MLNDELISDEVTIAWIRRFGMIWTIRQMVNTLTYHRGI